MSTFPYHLIQSEEGQRTLTLYFSEGSKVVRDDHPYFDELLDEVQSSFPDVGYLAEKSDPEKVLAEAFSRLSDRVSVGNGRIYLDGDDVSEGALGKHILRCLETGVQDYAPFVRFLEKLAANPLDHTKHRLYGWLDATGGFTITEDGDIIGYKGVDEDGRSVRSGPAIVDGKRIHGKVPNTPGATIEFPRSEVEHDPSRGCAQGLHIGTWEYASGWGDRTLRVVFSPTDVVSVPTDSGDQKVRVCRYTVLADAYGKSDQAIEVVGG